MLADDDNDRERKNLNDHEDQIKLGGDVDFRMTLKPLIKAHVIG